FKEKLKNWLLSADGDFIIVIIDTQNNYLYLFNDIFGRLPLYFQSGETGVSISRYLGFIANLDSEHEFDKAALSQYFVFGYMLGRRTLFKKINHLRPASFLT